MSQYHAEDGGGGGRKEGLQLSGGAIASLSGLALLVVFMLQNTEDVRLDFLVWGFTWPLWLLTLVSAVVGRSCGSAWESSVVTAAAKSVARTVGTDRICLVLARVTVRDPRRREVEQLVSHELGHAAVEPPGAVRVVERVVVAADELDRPALLALQDEDHVADGRGLVVVPVGDERVEHEVALRPPRRPLRVGGAERVVALVGAQARDLAHAVGAEGGDDVVGAAVVERLGVGGDAWRARPRRRRRT